MINENELMRDSLLAHCGGLSASAKALHSILRVIGYKYNSPNYEGHDIIEEFDVDMESVRESIDSISNNYDLICGTLERYLSIESNDSYDSNLDLEDTEDDSGEKVFTNSEADCGDLDCDICNDPYLEDEDEDEDEDEESFNKCRMSFHAPKEKKDEGVCLFRDKEID